MEGDGGMSVPSWKDDNVYQHITADEWNAMPEEMQELAREVRPWDLILPGTPRAHRQVADARYDECKACDDFQRLTRTCGICHCVMKVKVHLADAYCPKGVWGAVTQEGTVV